MTSTGHFFDGRCGIVTGGSSGIGAAVAALLASGGARVGVVARGAPNAGWTTRTERVYAYSADVTDLAGLAAAFRSCESDLGHLDFVIACAGAGHQGSLRDSRPEDWRRVLATNLLGAAYTARLALDAFARASRPADLVLVASVAGRRAYSGEPAYIASKWGVVGLGRALRAAPESRVRTTLVEPGLVDTPMTHSGPEVQAWLSAVDPLTPDDVAQTIAFAMGQPAGVTLDELVLRPVRQEI